MAVYLWLGNRDAHLEKNVDASLWITSSGDFLCIFLAWCAMTKVSEFEPGLFYLQSNFYNGCKTAPYCNCSGVAHSANLRFIQEHHLSSLE